VTCWYGEKINRVIINVVVFDLYTLYHLICVGNCAAVSAM